MSKPIILNSLNKSEKSIGNGDIINGGEAHGAKKSHTSPEQNLLKDPHP